MVMISYMRCLFLCARIAGADGGATGAAAADAAKGGIIAKRWCAACHLVAPDQTKANSDAPSFASIAHKKPTSKALSAFLTDPHPKMPDMSLTRDEIADIVAYIKGLDR